MTEESMSMLSSGHATDAVVFLPGTAVDSVLDIS
jgi:hypothetical protein